MLKRILALIYKEFFAVWRDKKSRIALIIPPLLQLFIFAFAGTLDVKNVSIGILNLDNGRESFELLERFYGSPTFNKIVPLHSIEEIAQAIDNQTVIMVIHIDGQFSRDLRAKKNATVQFILDGRKSNTAQIVEGYATRIVEQFNRDFTTHINFTQQNTEIFPLNWFNPNLIYYWFNVPNLSGILTMIVALTVTALSIARERELGTFDQLLVSPLRPIEMLIGKMIPALIIALIEGTVIIAAAIFIFNIPFTGSLLLLYLSLFVFICSVMGVGIFISSLSTTQQQAILGAFFFMTPAVLLSGYATPIENMPLWLQQVTIFNPLRYYLVIAKGLFFKDMPIYIVFENIWPMALIACFTLIGAIWFFRRRLA